jgi:hypothetical protein
MLLHQIFGYDWLGTRPYIMDPTFTAGFGRLVIGLEHWVAIFAALMPLVALLGLVIIPGLAQSLSKLWRGQGTFEQMVNMLTLASIASNLVIGATSECYPGQLSDPTALGRTAWHVQRCHPLFANALERRTLR